MRDPALPVRPARLAGTWYPADPAAFEALVPALAAAGGGVADARALIAPHAGVRYSGRTAAAAYGCLDPSRVRRAVVLGPSHFVPLRGVALQRAAGYETPFGVLEVDLELQDVLLRQGVVRDESAALEQEHSLELQLPFLRRRLPRARVLPLAVGRLDEREACALVEALLPWLDEESVVVASSDFTHYGERFGFRPAPSPTVRDTVQHLDRTSFRCIEGRRRQGLRRHRSETGTTICGAQPLDVLLRLSEHLDLDARLLEYTTSGDLLGDWSHSVSYAALLLERGDRLDPAERRFLLQEAGRAVREAAGAPARSAPRSMDTASLRSRRGAFITLRRGSELRGCIGRLAGTPDLRGAVVAAARGAACEDPRYPAVRADELPDLELEVTVLMPGLRLEDPRAFRIGVEGVMVAAGERHALFLPQVATEHGLDEEGLWRALCRKAGLSQERWRDPDVERYRVGAETLGPCRVGGDA